MPTNEAWQHIGNLASLLTEKGRTDAEATARDAKRLKVAKAKREAIARRNTASRAEKAARKDGQIV